MVNGDSLIGLRPVDTARAGDRFDPFRCGLDHLSFGVASKAEVEAAVQAFEEHGVERGGITDLADRSAAGRWCGGALRAVRGLASCSA
jgi:glyoxylase I family protein